MEDEDVFVVVSVVKMKFVAVVYVYLVNENALIIHVQFVSKHNQLKKNSHQKNEIFLGLNQEEEKTNSSSLLLKK